MQMTNDITHQPLPGLGLKLQFVGIDLAPNAQLETGLTVIDRNRQMVRMDKLYRDDEIIQTVSCLGPATGILVVMDMPKNLSFPGRWRQEEVKMHPLRLQRLSGERGNRYDDRGHRLYQILTEQGVSVLMYVNYWARVNYQMLLPFRSRSSQGCRALQVAIEHQLGIQGLPVNLMPSSVLESMVGAYASWALWAGKPGIDYSLYQNTEPYTFLVPKGRPHLRQPLEPRWSKHRLKLRIRRPFPRIPKKKPTQKETPSS
jgi:hypothetical protein